jgi:glycerol-3-phosphate acyltransferase PlsY
MWTDTLLVLGAYLFGAFPVVYLIGRIRGHDLSKEEDMHSGLWHKVGRREGFIGIGWDVVKGCVAVVIVDRVFDFGESTVVAVGLAVIVGLMWSIFLGFRGEKGNTTSLGVASALAYKALPFMFGPILVGVILRTLPRVLDSKQSGNERLKFGGPPSMSLPLGMLAGFALFPVGCWYTNQPWETTVGGIVIFLLIVVKRITAGLGEDLKTARTSKGSILFCRTLLDRSYL